MNLDEFYAVDDRRRRSGEADYGVHWTDGPNWPTYRVSYIRATGEVYAVSLDAHRRVEVLGIVPADENYDENEFGRYYYRTLDGILEGWATERSLQWLRERLAPYQREAA